MVINLDILKTCCKVAALLLGFTLFLLPFIAILP